MIRSVFIDQNFQKTYNLPVEKISEALKLPNGLLWVNLQSPTPDESTAILQDLFHFHPLAIEDALSEGYQTPKVDEYSGYLFIIMHAIHAHTQFHQIDTVEVNFFLGDNYLVTLFHEQELPPLLNVWTRLERDERLLENGSDFLCHAILDSIVDDYLPVLDNLDDELEVLEDQVVATPSAAMLENLLEIKHSLVFLRRVISPQREVMNRLSRDDLPMIDRQSRIYFRDIYDHLVRFQDTIESLRDIVSGSMDIYLNSTSLRMNEIMKALTIVATIFLPLSFVAGVYGMNFTNNLPQYDWKYGIEFFWFVCLLITFGMLYYFKRKDWF